MKGFKSAETTESIQNAGLVLERLVNHFHT